MIARSLVKRSSSGNAEGSASRRDGKTLIELLVVMAIIALMLGLFLTGAHFIWQAIDRFR